MIIPATYRTTCYNMFDAVTLIYDAQRRELHVFKTRESKASGMDHNNVVG